MNELVLIEEKLFRARSLLDRVLQNAQSVGKYATLADTEGRLFLLSVSAFMQFVQEDLELKALFDAVKALTENSRSTYISSRAEEIREACFEIGNYFLQLERFEETIKRVESQGKWIDPFSNRTKTTTAQSLFEKMNRVSTQDFYRWHAQDFSTLVQVLVGDANGLNGIVSRWPNEEVWQGERFKKNIGLLVEIYHDLNNIESYEHRIRNVDAAEIVWELYCLQNPALRPNLSLPLQIMKNLIETSAQSRFFETRVISDAVSRIYETLIVPLEVEARIVKIMINRGVALQQVEEIQQILKELIAETMKTQPDESRIKRYLSKAFDLGATEAIRAIIQGLSKPEIAETLKGICNSLGILP